MKWIPTGCPFGWKSECLYFTNALSNRQSRACRRVSIPFGPLVESLMGSHFLRLSLCISVLLVICVHAHSSSLARQREDQSTWVVSGIASTYHASLSSDLSDCDVELERNVISLIGRASTLPWARIRATFKKMPARGTLEP